MHGNYITANKAAMLRWKELHKHCTLGWVGGGVVDEQEEARRIILLQEEKAEYRKFWDNMWQHDRFGDKRRNTWGTDAPLFLSLTMFSGPCPILYTGSPYFV